MIVGHIQDLDLNLVGTINKENGGFRIWLRTRDKESSATNTHQADAALYPTFAAARQAVYNIGKNLAVNVKK